MLTGIAYTLPYALFGLLAGKITDKVNRKWALAIVIGLSAACMGVKGAVNSFGVLFAMRVFEGILSSATNPLSFSIIGDYFPPDKRATANSIIHSGSYIGNAMSSISILLISSLGWRSTYGVVAGVSALAAVLISTLIKEPERGVYVP